MKLADSQFEPISTMYIRSHLVSFAIQSTNRGISITIDLPCRIVVIIILQPTSTSGSGRIAVENERK